VSDLVAPARRLATSWPGDAVVAAVLVSGSAAYLATLAIRPGQFALAMVVVVVVAAALAVRRLWPVAATVASAAAVLAVWPLGLTFIPNGLLGGPLVYVLLLICYSLAVATSLVTSVTGTVLLAVSPQVKGGFNPFVLVATVGAWLAGRVVLSRRRMTAQLEARNAELAAERELFAQESVRYERARIARELHDIVAHCLSVMVVQAGAGQRVADTDRMAQALESVAEAAAQAQTEIARLVELLSGELASGPPPGLAAVGELVRRAETAGLDVRCRLASGGDRLAQAASQAAYRVVQEALTNALKHAPGAPVDIAVTEHATGVEVSVLNAAPRQPPSGLERSGTSHGLAGMRERVTACGGSLLAGPTATGGWQVTATLPWGVFPANETQ
jgi:signal transduction histidine kinase